MDLVIAEPPLQSPSRIVWIELKDIGRSHHTLLANAKGLGNDFAALWSLRPLETQQTWLNPPDHAVDRGRLPEWDAYGPGILGAQHLIAQIVIVPKTAWQLISTADMESLWLGAFEQRTKSNAKNEGVLIARRDTKVFSVYAVVHQLPTKG